MLTNAAWAAQRLGQPLNTLLTIRWEDISAPGRTPSLSEQIRQLVEKIRKWLTRNRLSVVYIWVREATTGVGEHWHFTLHLPKKLQRVFAAFLGGILADPPQTNPRSAFERTIGEFACGETGGWHLAAEARENSQFPGYWLAAYLGKGEPSERMFRGKMVINKKKPMRGREFDGVIPSERYDAMQGEIEGTLHRKKRHDISKTLRQAMKAWEM